MAKKAEASAKAVVAGEAKVGKKFDGDVTLFETPEGGVRVEVKFTHKDASGRSWISSCSGSGKNKEEALTDLQNGFAKTNMKIRAIAESCLDSVKNKSGKINKPIAAIDLSVLPESKLRDMAKGYPQIPPDASKEDLVAALTEMRAKSLKDTEARIEDL